MRCFPTRKRAPVTEHRRASRRPPGLVAQLADHAPSSTPQVRLSQTATAARSFVQISDGGEVLRDVAKRFVDRDLPLVLPPFDAAGEHLADLGDDVTVVDKPGIPRRGKLGSLGDHSGTIISDITCPRYQRRVDLDRPEQTRPDEVNVRTVPYSIIQKDWPGR